MKRFARFRAVRTMFEQRERESAERVVSLDYCADQFVLKLLPRDRILAVSPTLIASFPTCATRLALQQVRPLQRTF